MKIPTPDSNSATTRFSRREAFMSIAALAAVGPAASGQQVAAQSGPKPRIVFSDTNAVVEIATGRIRGYSDDGIHTFKGIPYASPPTGALRFMPPEPPTPWANVRNTLPLRTGVSSGNRAI